MEKILAAINAGGSTYDYLRNIDYSGTPNISVTPFPERSMIVEGEVTEHHLTNFRKRNSDLFSQEGFAQGGWYNSENKKTYLDVAVIIPKSNEAQAEQLHIDSNQIASFDLERLIETLWKKGTGEVVPGMPSFKKRLAYAKEILGLPRA